MDIFDRIMFTIIAVGGATAIIFFWLLGYIMLLQAGVFA